MWNSFFDAEKILSVLDINNQIGDVAEFGCGYGTFTIPVARIIRGRIYAFDIEPEMISATNNEALKHGLKNIVTTLRDFITEGTDLKSASVDYAMLFNILHLENPIGLLLEANRILVKGGKIGIVHWNYDPLTPRGPSMNIRPKPEQCSEWANKAGFGSPKQFDLKPYHYGIVMTKEEMK